MTGSETAGWTVFLDRDGTLNVEDGYLTSADNLRLIAGATEGIALLRGLGVRVVLVTNQSGIGRGFIDRGGLERIHLRVIELLREEGTDLDGIYVCPHVPGAGCDCRKPLPGLIRRAASELVLDLGRAFMVGDKASDIEAGRRAGTRTVLVRTGHGREAEAKGCAPDFVADDLLAASRLIREQIAGGARFAG